MYLVFMLLLVIVSEKMSWFYVKFMFGKYINIFTEFAIFTKPTMIVIKQEFVAMY